MTRWPIVIGIGSDHGDDSAGWVAVERLFELGWPVESALVARHPSELLDWCDQNRELIVCDACTGTGDAGTCRQFTWPAEQLPTSPPRSSHELSLTYVLELGRTLGRLPTSVSVWAILGHTWSPNTPISPDVRTAARLVADDIHTSVFGSAPRS